MSERKILSLLTGGSTSRKPQPNTETIESQRRKDDADKIERLTADLKAATEALARANAEIESLAAIREQHATATAKIAALQSSLDAEQQARERAEATARELMSRPPVVLRETITTQAPAPAQQPALPPPEYVLQVHTTDEVGRIRTMKITPVGRGT